MKTILRPPGRALPSYLRNKLANPPRAGSGLHNWLFRMSLLLHRFLPPDRIRQLLADAVKECGRDVPEREIHDAVRNSMPRARSKGGRAAGAAAGVKSKAKPKWPKVDEIFRAKILAESPTSLIELGALSPLQIDGGVPDANWFLEKLFEPGDLICMGASNRVFATHPRDQFVAVELRESCLIVPTPMTAKWGATQLGKRSQHTLSNTGSRRYLITEFDSGTADEQAALICHLRGFAPLVMVLSSGGKSLHAWWNCVGSGEPEHLRFFRYAVSVGADPATWTRSQFVRLPQGWRADNCARQQVHFFNPANLPAANPERGAL